jgi:hypothetical protein
MKKCQAITGKGRRCQRIVGASQSYCYSHDPSRKEERKANAARGGRVKATGEISRLKVQLKSLADNTLAGEIDRSVAAVCNQIYGTILAAIRTEMKVKEIQEHEERLQELERLASQRSLRH